MIISGGLMGSLGYNPQGRTTKRVSGFFSSGYTGMMLDPGVVFFFGLLKPYPPLRCIPRGIYLSVISRMRKRYTWQPPIGRCETPYANAKSPRTRDPLGDPFDRSTG